MAKPDTNQGLQQVIQIDLKRCGMSANVTNLHPSHNW